MDKTIKWDLKKMKNLKKKQATGNYRSISVLLAAALAYKRLIHNQLSNCFEANGYLTKCQLGFRKFHSSLMAILKSSNDWFLNMDDGSYQWDGTF